MLLDVIIRYINDLCDDFIDSWETIELWHLENGWEVI